MPIGPFLRIGHSALIRLTRSKADHHFVIDDLHACDKSALCQKVYRFKPDSVSACAHAPEALSYLMSIFYPENKMRSLLFSFFCWCHFSGICSSCEIKEFVTPLFICMSEMEIRNCTLLRLNSRLTRSMV